MTTTPTFWSEVTLSLDNLAAAPAVTALANDTFVFGYQSGSDIAGFKTDAFGNINGGNFLFPLTSATDHILEALHFAQQADGTVAVLYQEDVPAPAGTQGDIIWHLAEGDALNRTPLVDSSDTEHLKDAIALGTGTAFTFDAIGPNNSNLQVLKFVDANGMSPAGGFVVGNHANQSQFDSVIAGLDNGNVVVAYTNIADSAQGGISDLRLHIVTPQGGDVADGGNGSHEVIVTNSIHAVTPDIAVTNGDTREIPNDGAIVAVWRDQDGIEFRRFSDEHALAIDTTPQTISGSGGGINPHVAALNDGGFLVEWVQAFGKDSKGFPDFDIVLQRFDLSGNPVGDRLFIDKPGSQGLGGVSITTLSDGRVAVIFRNETGDSTGVHRLDEVILDPRDKLIDGTSKDDTILGRKDGSTINGLGGNDHLVGFKAVDVLNGGNGNDRLSADIGNDSLNGGNDSDVLTGGLGKDILRGGAGADRFVFNALAESKPGSARDVISDFMHAAADRIDLRGIDANTRVAGNQAFHFIAVQPFHHKPGELHFVLQNHPGTAADKTIVEGDVNGDGRPDVQIELHGLHKLVSQDFLL
jgi:Ca2+-binding RTX toxin-like protein